MVTRKMEVFKFFKTAIFCAKNPGKMLPGNIVNKSDKTYVKGNNFILSDLMRM